MEFLTRFEEELYMAIQSLGGTWNAHLHLDRSNTWPFGPGYDRALSQKSLSALSLQTKHTLIEKLHASELYEPTLLKGRTGALLEAIAASGSFRADSSVDVVGETIGDGAAQAFLALKEEMRGRIDFKIGAYNPLGFPAHDYSRMDFLEETAAKLDFLVSLPEKDELQRYPEHIGFEESVRRIADIGIRLGKEIHFHLDQVNTPHQFETERALAVLERYRKDLSKGQVWFVHVISPSSYPLERIRDLGVAMTSLGIGLIVCPSASISMRQLRGIAGPTRNSIAPVLEMVAEGVDLRLGSDNIGDITSPAGTVDLRKEVFVLSHALRYFDVDFLARVSSGQPISNRIRERVRAHLTESRASEAVEAHFFQHG